MRMTSQQWTVASLGSGAMALVCLLLAVATTHWLHLTETCYKFTTLPFEGVNISLWANFTMWTNVGLWQLCSITDTGKCTSVIFTLVFIMTIYYKNS